MSNLVKPYEISVWDDIWDSDKGKFIEKKLLVIGTDEMTSLNRALEPVLTRNVNGTKKFSFKMYKRYIDRETGEEVHNLFIDYLINERKVKLKYGVDDEGNDKWYDFIIKNINETSTTYLYQFDLEDAIVQELSKNGFGVTLDAQLKNNMGTADELAEKVLADTNWQVSGSDKLVQEVKEHLVYVSAPTTLLAWKLKNSGANYDSEGVIEDFTTLNTTGKTVLAFYSSCTGTPHRFQFIILPEYIEKNEDNVIINTDCQYFIECSPEDYTVENDDYGFKLPTGWSVQDQGDVETSDKDTTVSYKYRGNRFGYAQQAVYLPKLDRYVNKYTNSSYKNEDGTNKIIYGYIDNEYVSPVLMTNLISNTDFKNTSGWKGVGYTNESTLSKKPTAENKPVVENVYGRFDGDNFISATTDLTNGAFSDTQTYEAYMKLDFSQVETLSGVTPIVINSGPFDNRTLINKIVEGDEWALYVENREGNWPTGLTFTLEEVTYDSVTGCYKPTNSGKISFTSSTTFSPQIFTFGECDYSDKTFKKNVKLHLKITGSGTHYIKTIELHKVVRDKDNKIIRLNAQADKIDEGIVNTKYFYFTEEAYDAAITKDEIKYIHTADKAEPSRYEPVYNVGAEKIRSVTAKESNYFNILQSIAETFEAWLDLKIIRDTNGAVIGKQVSFKKYSGGDNYAAFRYGVNLKDITRTIESKQIVTKLIVKNNSNELAPNKFCTIQRAPSNVSGENYIYDFQYYHNNGLLDANNYLNELYYTAGASGLDIEYQKYEESVKNKDNPLYEIQVNTNTNIKGYFPRLKALNNKLVDINDKMSGLSQELLQLKAEREVAEATYEAAESGIEQTSEDFETLTGFSIDAYNIEDISTTIGYDRVDSFEIPQTIDENSKHKLVYDIQPDENGPLYLISPTITREANGQYKLSCTAVRSWLQQDGGIGTYKIIKATYYICASIGGKYKYIAQNIKVEFKGFSDKKTTQESEKISDAIITSVDVTRSDINKLLTEYLSYQKEKKSSGDEKERLTALIDGTVKLDEDNKPILENGELKRNDDGKQKQYDILKQQFEDIRDNQKLPLNQAFFQKYSRFIQEGTWIDEQYVDDEKYYNDAQTVLYNSCYPKVGYTINVLSLSKMPGYELFVFDVGEKTYAEDEEFFGTDESGYPNRTEIIITEMSEHLDNPSADSIKVQNFKNQFQDLFQKITATVQQTQYNEGTYRKGAALVEASNEKKNEFLLDSLSDPASVLSNAGQNEVVWDNAGITVTNKNNRSEQLRLVSSGIMFSTDSESGPKWSTGITPQGISANKILAGSINTGEISLMNGKDTSFLWNAFGINAFDYEIENGTVTSVNKSKFVRFDRNGIYGINGQANADAWKPNSLNEVDEKATFALTWEGLKITGNNGVIARIGKVDDKIISITNQGNNIFSITNNGHASLSGSVVISGNASTGDTGVTLDNISTGSYSEYGFSSEEKVQPTVWENATPQGYNSARHYLWQRIVTTYTVKETSYSDAVIIARPISVYSIEISNENIQLPTNSNGDLYGDTTNENALLKELTSVTAHLYEGIQEITENVEYTWYFKNYEDSVEIVQNGNSMYLQLIEGKSSINMPDSIIVKLNIKYRPTEGSEFDFADKTINIIKVKGGAPGEYATVYEIRPESAAINISKWNYNENIFNVEVYKIQETSEKFTLTSDSDPYLDVQGGTVTYDGGIAKIKLKEGSDKLNLYLRRGSNQTILDYETVSFIKNGADGAPAEFLVLSNESDVISKNKNGKIISKLPITIQASITNSEYKLPLENINPPSSEWGKNGDGYYSYNEATGILSISAIPNKFNEGKFRFEYNDTFKYFTLKVVQSEVDYNLEFDTTLINSSNGGSFNIRVSKTDASGAVSYQTEYNINSEIQIFKDNDYEPLRDWTIYFEKDTITPMTFVLKDTKKFEWDRQVVEFIKNGENGGGIEIEYGFYQASSQIPDPPEIFDDGAIKDYKKWVLVEKYPNDLDNVSQPKTSITDPYLYKYIWTKYTDGTINQGAIIKVGEHPSVFGETYQEVLFLSQKDISADVNNNPPLPNPPSIPEGNKVTSNTWYKVEKGESLPVTVIFNGNTVEKPLRYTRTVQKYEYPKNKITATKPVLDMAIQNVVNWCSINNSTLIDGGNIYAGSISAGLMNTNAIRSLNYKAYANSALISTSDGKVNDPETKFIPYINQDNQEDPTGDNTNFAYQGTFLDLANGNIYSKNFRIVDGNAYFRGYMEANDGSIGPLSITQDAIVAFQQTENIVSEEITNSLDHNIYQAYIYRNDNTNKLCWTSAKKTEAIWKPEGYNTLIMATTSIRRFQNYAATKGNGEKIKITVDANYNFNTEDGGYATLFIGVWSQSGHYGNSGLYGYFVDTAYGLVEYQGNTEYGWQPICEWDSEINKNYYVGLFSDAIGYNAQASMKVEKRTEQVHISSDGFFGKFIVTKKSSTDGLKQLYIDSNGELCTV